MHIEQKQNRIYRPQSNTTLSAEESNQVTTELENLITEGGLTPNAGTLTQVKDSVTALIGTAANNLQSQIDAITSASDVFDVVGTYTDLQNYDTSTVPTNDIIKVLQDSTHNNAATYYRWSGSAWVYVGQEGPYYTKSEIDTDFALKSQLPTIATTSQVGLVKPDGSTVSVQADGTLSVSGSVTAALPLFTHIWADHVMNDASYLKANDFSWQSGSVYTAGYNHLVNDIAGKTAQTETIGSYTITFYLADDGHKIVLADQETTVQNIYGANGVAWYYILDTANVRFKLPRSTQGHGQLVESYSNGTDWYRKYADGWCEQGGIDLFASVGPRTATINLLKPFKDENYTVFLNCFGSQGAPGIRISAQSVNSFTYVQQSAEYNYVGTKIFWEAKGYVSSVTNPFEPQGQCLYFYVGNFSQSAIEQTAGLNASLFNGKADVDFSNITADAKKVVFGRAFTPANITIAKGNASIAGTYTLTDLPNDGVVRLVLLNCRLVLGANNRSSMAIQTDVMSNYIIVAETNNGFTASGAVLVPMIRQVTLSFPQTAGGVMADTEFMFRGYI